MKSSTKTNNKYLCSCGCGGELSIAKYSSKHKGWIKGQPVRYIHGHNNKGKKFSEEHKRKISESNKGKIMPESFRKAVSERMKGNIPSEKTRKKLSEAGKNQVFSLERRKKISEALKGPKNHMHGKKMPLETRKKISKALKGKPKSKEHIKALSGKNNHNYKRKFSKEYRDKISKAGKGRIITEEHRRKISIAISGHNHYNWKGGITCEPYCDAWADKDYKESIKERDNHECQNPKCRKNSKRIGIHHIDYIKMNCEPMNLITLCISCNSRANYNRKYWQDLYGKIMLLKYDYLCPGGK